MNIVSLLAEIRVILENPDRWTKFKVARNTKGIGVSALNSEARSFCLVGAINLACHKYEYLDEKFVVEGVWSAICKATGVKNNSGLAMWNDQHNITHEQVLGAIDKAIAISA